MSGGLRVDGHLPLREYAAIGDGRTAALVGSDGSVDWLCLPDLDSPSVLGALLDAERGGRFRLEPTVPYESERRYLPDSNVLETTFRTAGGTVRVTDALTLPGPALAPYRELVRRVDGLHGSVPLRWSVEPRFGYGTRPAAFRLRAGVPIAADGADAVAVVGHGAGRTNVGDGTVSAELVATPGTGALVVLAAARGEPLVLPSRRDVEERLAATATSWRRWAAGLAYDGPWRGAVLRSALALKLLVFAPSGAIAAALTTSLPERIGGGRNWDYRFSWPRDAAFTVRALLALGAASEAEAHVSWTLHASQLTQPRLQTLYRLDGRVESRERELPLPGYRGSRPVRIGNGAAAQLQLDVYGEVLDAAVALADHRGGLDRDHARRLAAIADHVCEAWRGPDAGIWEVRSEPLHFTHSKMLCAVALARAAELADRDVLPRARRSRWRAEEGRIRAFVEARCWSEAARSYVRAPGSGELDAALLLGVTSRYDEPDAPRLVATVTAIRRELADGPLLRRYRGADDGLAGAEGAFVACSFWLAEALARQGRVDDAAELMDGMVGRANDVGLFSEQIEPASGEFLGNLPQGLSHLALINAAVAIAEATR